jgi:hypothetical protein
VNSFKRLSLLELVKHLQGYYKVLRRIGFQSPSHLFARPSPTYPQKICAEKVTRGGIIALNHTERELNRFAEPTSRTHHTTEPERIGALVNRQPLLLLRASGKSPVKSKQDLPPKTIAPHIGYCFLNVRSYSSSRSINKKIPGCCFFLREISLISFLWSGVSEFIRLLN